MKVNKVLVILKVKKAKLQIKNTLQFSKYWTKKGSLLEVFAGMKMVELTGILKAYKMFWTHNYRLLSNNTKKCFWIAHKVTNI
jgi:hypothetical protein